MIRRSVAVLTAAMVLGTLWTPAPVSASGAAADPTIGLLRIGGDFSAASSTSSFGYVVIHASEHHLIPELKAANPDVKVLVYKDMAAAADYMGSDGVDHPLLPAGVGYYWTEQNRPDWFLRDTDGNRIEWCDYPGNWHLDVGDPDYQALWLDNVTAELEQYGWDGVMIDDAMASAWNHLCGRTIAKYPTDAEYGAATESFLAKVGPGITDRGFLALPNINDADLEQWKRWVGYTSGGVREYWMKAGVAEFGDRFGDHHWQFLMDKFEATDGAGKAFVGITYSSMNDVEAMRYARASFLLGHQGGPSAMIYHPGKNIDGWSSEWTVNVGDPLGPRYAVGDAWRRDFGAGTVVVNPTTTKTVTVDLGAPYAMPDGTPVTSVTLEPTSGLILLSESSTTPGDGDAPGETDPVQVEPVDEAPTDEVVDPAPEPVKLKGKKVRPRKIKLRWADAKTKRVVIYRRNRRIARVRADAGRFVTRVRKARAPKRFYRVCEVGSGRCSKRIRPTRRTWVG